MCNPEITARKFLTRCNIQLVARCRSEKLIHCFRNGVRKQWLHMLLLKIAYRTLEFNKAFLQDLSVNIEEETYAVSKGILFFNRGLLISSSFHTSC